MLRSLFCEDISVEYELESEKLREVPIDLKLNNLDLSGNTTEFKTLPTRPRSHRYILTYIFAMESVKICRFKTCLVGIFAWRSLYVPFTYFRFSAYMLKCVFC